jgi:hypothetical protein
MQSASATRTGSHSGKRKPPPAFGTPWTHTEVKRLKAAFAKGGLKAAVAEFPERNPPGIHGKLKRLGLRKCRLWTPREAAKLREMWGSVPLKDLTEFFNRQATHIFAKAKRMGLKTGCPQGWESLAHAAKRTGYHEKTLKIVLRWAGVRPERWMGNPNDRRVQGCYHRRIVQPTDVDEAVERWVRCESVVDAARRHGVNPVTLRSWLKTAGYTRDRSYALWRLEPSVVDDLVAQRRAGR